MQEIFEFLNKSFYDGYFSRSEKKALKAELEIRNPSSHELNWLRSQIFELVRSKISGSENRNLINWLEGINKIIIPKSPADEYNKVFFNPGKDCLHAINERIVYATSKIDICVFTISEDQIKEKLLYAKQKGVKIRIITDNDKSFDRGSDVKSLSEYGIPVKIDRTEHHMHHKFAVFDEKFVVTGSFNWTRSASDFNHENIIVTNNKSAVDRYQEEFNRLWKSMQNIEK